MCVSCVSCNRCSSGDLKNLRFCVWSHNFEPGDLLWTARFLIFKMYLKCWFQSLMPLLQTDKQAMPDKHIFLVMIRKDENIVNHFFFQKHCGRTLFAKAISITFVVSGGWRRQWENVVSALIPWHPPQTHPPRICTIWRERCPQGTTTFPILWWCKSLPAGDTLHPGEGTSEIVENAFVSVGTLKDFYSFESYLCFIF